MSSTALTLPAGAGAAPTVNKWGVAISVALGALLEIIDTSIVNVALTHMQASLGATLAQVSWVVSSYGIANVIILPLSAWLGHRFGKKNYFLFSLIGFTLASVLCGLATNLITLILARVLQGLTGGGLLAKAQAILFETFPKEEQALAQGLFGSIVIAGPAIGPTLGGYLVTNIDWRWIFFINIPVGLVAVMMVMTYMPKDPPRTAQRASVDWTAIGLLALGLGSIQAFLEEGNSEDWFDSRLVIMLALCGVVGTLAFVLRVLRSPDPVVDLRVLRYRSLWSGALLSMVIGMALYGALFAVPIFAQSFLHYSAQQTGMLLLPGALVSAFCMPIVAKLSQRFDARKVLVFGACILVSALGMLTHLSPLTGGDDLFWPLVVRAFGTVFMFMPLQLAALGPIPKQDIASATGFFSLTRQLGGSVGVALLTLLLDKRQVFHHAVLNEKLGASDPQVLDRLRGLTGAMLQQGFEPEVAKQKALALLDGLVRQQAAIMSFADTFWATAAIVVVTLPLVLLLGRGKGSQVDMGH